MNRSTRSLVALLGLLLFQGAAAGAAAQEPTVLEPGSRVRFWLAPDPEVGDGEPLRYAGTVLGITTDTMTVRLHRRLAPVSVPMRWVDQIEVSRGRESAGRAAWRAARATAIVGIILGAVIGNEVAQVDGRSGSRYFETVLGRAAMYGGTVAATAAIWGAMHPAERWAPGLVPLRASTSGHGLLIGAAFPL